MPPRFAKPTGESLNPHQRELVGAILSFLQSQEYDVGRIAAGMKPFVEGMRQLCSTNEDCAAMADELERWIRWQRVPAYWLAYVLQAALNGSASAHAITSRRIYADAQINLNDDVSLLSLESAFLVAGKIQAKYPEPAIEAAALAVAEYIRKIYAVFRNWYSTRPYFTIEPLSEHLYDLRMFLDVRDEFPDLKADDAIHPEPWLHAAKTCLAEEVYLRVIARKCAGWALEKANDFEGALAQYKLALSEAMDHGLETEIGHLLRYAANVLRRMGLLDQAELRLRLAIQVESHPELAYWQALSQRELARVLAAKGAAGADVTAMFNQGRESFDISMVSSAVPVARAVKEQIFRAYADDAIEAARTVSPLALLSEIEAAGPRYATDLVVESLLARQLPPEAATAFRHARAVYGEHRSLFLKETDEDDSDFIAYITAVKQNSAARDLYVTVRFPTRSSARRSRGRSTRLACLIFRSSSFTWPRSAPTRCWWTRTVEASHRSRSRSGSTSGADAVMAITRTWKRRWPPPCPATSSSKPRSAICWPSTRRCLGPY